MSVDLSGLIEKQRAEHLAALEVHKLNVKPGRRVAMVCPADGCTFRSFGDLEWTCPTHARAVRQVNRPYLGQPTA